MSAPALRISGLVAGYGHVRVLSGLDLSVAPGEVMVLLGRNGAGKSTTLKSVIGLVRPDAGSVEVFGREVAGLAPHVIARAGVGYVPETRRIFAELSVAENLEVGRRAAASGGRSGGAAGPEWDEARVFRLFPALAAMRERRGGHLSGGEQQMLTIARTLMGNPALILLDEPSEGLAPLVVAQIADTVAAMKAAGLTVLLSEQNARFAARVADRAALIDRGRIVAEGPAAEIAARDDAAGF